LRILVCAALAAAQLPLNSTACFASYEKKKHKICRQYKQYKSNDKFKAWRFTKD